MKKNFIVKKFEYFISLLTGLDYVERFYKADNVLN